ncbi:MAG: pyridoxal phosphate-dependent aminotransferase [Spirochaetales bacterium]|nr:pyridoxal phosphate-dependent aminotransferase [Spirochaetales bacterium]
MKFSSRIAPQTEPNAIASLVAELSAQGASILNLSDSNPTRAGLLPCSDSDGAGEGSIGIPGYGSWQRYEPDPRGLLAARQALSGKFGGDPDDYFITASSSESYSLLFKLVCDAGDAVLVPRPGYPLFEHLAGLDCVRAESYRIEYTHPAGWRIDMDDLRRVAQRSQARALVVINPNNPTGSYLSSDEHQAVVSICAELGMALIADEVFFPYALEAEQAHSRFAGESGCLTFSLDGLSKLLCLPQVKLGWLRVSGPVAEAREAARRLEVISDAYLSASAPIMTSLSGLLGRSDAFVRRVQRRMTKNLAYARRVFEEPGSPYRVLRCEGGWTALLEYPRNEPEEQTVLGLLREERIVVQPGYFFDMERDGYLALSLILEPGDFEAGAHRVRKYIDSTMYHAESCLSE